MPSIYDWKLNPDENQTVDTLAWWKEGQPPSTVNNSARGMMTRVAELLGDSLGTIKASLDTEGAYSVTINSKIEAYDPRLKFEVFFPVVGLKTPMFKVNELTALPMVKRQLVKSSSQGKTGAGFVYTLKVLGVSDMCANAIHILKFIPPDIAKDMAPKDNITDYGSGVFLVETLSVEVESNVSTVLTAVLKNNFYEVALDTSISAYNPNIKLEVYFPKTSGLIVPITEQGTQYLKINGLPPLPLVKNQRDLAAVKDGKIYGVVSKFLALHPQDLTDNSIHTIRYIPPEIVKSKGIIDYPQFDDGVFLVETAEEQRVIRHWAGNCKIFADFTCEIYKERAQARKNGFANLTTPHVVLNRSGTVGGGGTGTTFPWLMVEATPQGEDYDVRYFDSGYYTYTLHASISHITGITSSVDIPPFFDIRHGFRSLGQY